MPAHKVIAPTAMQTRAYEAVMRLGTQAAAAKKLETYQGTIRGAVLRYCAITGADLPAGMTAGARTLSAAATLRAVPQRLVEIESRLSAMEGDLRALRVLVESFVHRQPVILGAGPTHRREADGGVGGRREVRRIARVVGG